MNEYNAVDRSPYEKLWEVLAAWGEEIETLPIEEVDLILATSGIDTESMLRIVNDKVGNKGTDKGREREIKPDVSRTSLSWEQAERLV